MENPEEILHSLEEFSKMKPKDIPRELEEYLCFVAKTGNPVYQWPTIKSLFREKLLSVITEFYEACPNVEIPPCPNIEMFNYDLMKNFILEKLDTFASAPFTVQRICELLTTPRKEYNRIDKYMRALEKNILVVSTTEPGRRSTENGEGIMNGIESEHLPESSNCSHDINVEEMDESPSWPRTAQVAPMLFESSENEENQATTEIQQTGDIQESFENGSDAKLEMPSSSTAVSTPSQVQNPQETVITCRSIDETQQPYVSIEPVVLNTCATSHQENIEENEADSSVTITAVPAGVQQRRNSVERAGTTEDISADVEAEVDTDEIKDTIVPELIEQKLPEKEEEGDAETPTSKEEILPTVPCPEPIIEPTTEAKIVVHSDETALVVQEESGIENISPENSSSSPETLQIDLNQEPEKNQPESIEKLEDQAKIEEKENISEATTNWTEETKEPQVLEECANTGASVPEVREAEENGIISTPSESTEECIDEEKTVDEAKEDSSVSPVLSEVSEVVEDPFDKISSTAELINNEQIEDKEADPVSAPPVSDSDCKIDCEETPMEVDIVSETEVEKKEEADVSEEPSSTSEAAAL